MRGNKASPPSSQRVDAEKEHASVLRILAAGISPGEIAQLEEVLRRADYEPVWQAVCVASRNIDTLSLAQCDLVILNGDERPSACVTTVRSLRDGGCDLPLLLLCAGGSEENVIDAIHAGVDEWVEKRNVSVQLPGAILRAVGAAAERRAALAAEESEALEAEVSEALAYVAFELLAAWDTRMLFDRLGHASVEVLKCDGCSTLMLDSGGDAFELVASFGWTAEEREIGRLVRAPRGLLAPVLERLATDDFVALKTKPMASVVSKPHEQWSHVFARLTQNGATVGVQIFTRRAGCAPFTPAQCRIATGVAELASLSLTHARVIDDLERAHRVKTDFVATVSHELRTPLHVVMGYTELLIEGTFGALTGEQVRALERISQRGRGLLDLINATLDLNRLEAGRISVDVERTDLARFMDTLYRETCELQNNPNLRLIWDVPEKLPSVTTDPAKLKVALKNLIANALKFTDAGSVTVRATADENEVEFAVIDTGVGIAPEALPIVFEAFRQADSSSTRRFGGVGLGLYIVRRLLDLLGGHVDVESTLGQGSTFRIRLPLQRAQG